MEIIKDVTLNIRQQGAETTTQSLVGVERATERAGRATGTFSKFIREQRTEQRQANFLYREGVGSLLVLANAFGSTSKEAKVLTQSLNAGFATFQGLNFLLAGMKGPMGIAIALVGGLAAAWAAFEPGAPGASAMDEYLQRLIRIGRVSKETAISIAKTTRAELELQLAELRSTVTETRQRPTGRMIFSAAGRSMVPEMESWQVTRQKGSADEIIGKLNEIAKKDEEILGYERAITDDREKSLKSLKEQEEWFQKFLDMTREIQGIRSGAFKGKFGAPGMPGAISGNRFVGIDNDQLMEDIRKDFDLTIELGLALGDTLRSSLGGAFEGIFGQANSLLEQFGQRIFEILGSRLIGTLFTIFGGPIGGIIGGAFGTFDPSTSGGGLSGESIRVEGAFRQPAFAMGVYRADAARRRLGRPT